MDKIEHYIDEDGDEHWKLNGLYHRTEGPAVIWSDGTCRWYRHGTLHRDGGPAVIWANGKLVWYIFGTPHTFDDYCTKLKLTPEQILELKLKYG